MIKSQEREGEDFLQLTYALQVKDTTLIAMDSNLRSTGLAICRQNPGMCQGAVEEVEHMAIVISAVDEVLRLYLRILT